MAGAARRDATKGRLTLEIKRNCSWVHSHVVSSAMSMLFQLSLLFLLDTVGKSGSRESRGGGVCGPEADDNIDERRRGRGRGMTSERACAAAERCWSMGIEKGEDGTGPDEAETRGTMGESNKAHQDRDVRPLARGSRATFRFRAGPFVTRLFPGTCIIAPFPGAQITACQIGRRDRRHRNGNKFASSGFIASSTAAHFSGKKMQGNAKH